MQQRGFSLVELSIVLVILGLLVGGVLTGKSLIHASELRSVTTQQQEWVSATHSFRDKYFAYPGDMPNATQFWGTLDPAPAACKSASSLNTIATCNGDGNGLIDSSVSSTETKRFWQHLANAGFIAGTYNGSAAVSRSMSGPGKDGPAGKLLASSWQVDFQSPNGKVTSGTTMFYGDYGNALSLLNNNRGTISRSLLAPEDIWNIDAKLDDGKLATGTVVVASDTTLDACSNVADPMDLTATYLLTSTAAVCGIVFRQQF